MKVQNIFKVIDQVVSMHTSLQNRLIGKETEKEEKSAFEEKTGSGFMIIQWLRLFKSI